MGFHYFVTLFEIVGHFTAFGFRFICNWLVNGADCFDLGQRCVGVLITLWDVDLLGDEFLLTALVGYAAIVVILRVSKSCLSRPVRIRTESNFGGVLIDLDLLIIDVAAAEHTRLQILMLTVTAVKAISV